ncbi:MAG: phosphatidylglycerophosphatase A [Magnetospirillum sp.]|nr:phosphatidylglycerophosphatase A [Magnetospirillum sp.]
MVGWRARVRAPLLPTETPLPCRPGISPLHPAALLSTWFGAGLLPKAPGTWGSAAALPFAWVIAGRWGSWGLAAAAGICFLVGWAASELYVRRTAADDPGEVVIDEVAGQWLVLAPAPLDPLYYLVGFALFRLLDIWKPWPAGWADRHLSGGLGVMADDMLAAAYGLLALLLLTR